MNANDHEKKLDEYIDALNAGRPTPQLVDDAELADLFATARDLHRLRATEAQPNDVPSRLAAALERELRVNPTHVTRRIASNDMSLFRDAPSNGMLRPPEGTRDTHAIPHRPERVRQWAQFAVASIAFILIGIVLSRIIGGGTDEPGGAVGTDPGETPTIQMAVPDVTATALSITPTPTTWATETPVDDSGIPMPTPSSAMSFAEARERTSFELVEPDSRPSSLTLTGLTLHSAWNLSTPGMLGPGPVDHVTAHYQHATAGSVQLDQSILACDDPGSPGATLDDVEIDGKAVRRAIEVDANGDTIASYRWLNGDICFTLYAILTDGVTEDLLTSFVASIRAHEVSAPTEPVDPIDQRPLLALSIDYVTCDDTVTAYGANFETGTTITIYGGQLIGDNFGPVVDEHPVADDGSFAVELDLARLIGECGGGSEEPEGSMFRLFASTGSSLVKDGVDVDGPSAMTVLTFSRDVPEGVRDREGFFYCGVEVMLSPTMLGEGGEPNKEARECFVSAVAAESVAEFVSYVQTSDGDIDTTIYRSIGLGEVELFANGTRSRWERYICDGLEMPDVEPYQFQFETCGNLIPIE